jgi:hypothetical protein
LDSRNGRARGAPESRITGGGQAREGVEQVFGHVEERDPEEHDQRHAQAPLLVHLGDEVAGRDVQGHARREGQGVAHAPVNAFMPSTPPSWPRPARSRDERTALPASRGEGDGGDGHAFGDLVEDHREEDEEAEGSGDEEAGRDGHAVEERVDGEADQGRDADGRVHHHLVVALLAEMEVGASVCSKNCTRK